MTAVIVYIQIAEGSEASLRRGHVSLAVDGGGGSDGENGVWLGLGGEGVQVIGEGVQGSVPQWAGLQRVGRISDGDGEWVTVMDRRLDCDCDW